MKEGEGGSAVSAEEGAEHGFRPRLDKRGEGNGEFPDS